MQNHDPKHQPVPLNAGHDTIAHAQPLRVPSRVRGKYTAKLAKLDPSMLYRHLDFRSEYCDRDHVIVPALGKLVDHGAILTYMFRRFGYPNDAWDRDSSIASYLISTPNPAMILKVEPHVTGSSLLSFSFMVDDRLLPILDLGAQRRAEISMWEKKDPLRPLAEAAWETLEDLLTPVEAGVMQINVKGYAGEDGPPIKPCAVAGYASGDLGNAAPAEFYELQDLINNMGAGDSKAGVLKALEVLKAFIAANTAAVDF